MKLNQRKRLMLKLRDENKTKNVGDNCVCPSCNSKFTKKSYQQIFCKLKGGSICKDKFYNIVDESKRNNTTRISTSNARFQRHNSNSLYYTHSNIVGYTQAELDKIDRESNELNFEGGEEGGNVYVERCNFCNCLNCRCDD